MAKFKRIKLPSNDTVYDIVDAGAVHYNESQSLTSTQQAQARTNIGAGTEDSSNKTTSITSSSTNTQYPSAKAVYDNAMMKSGGTFTGAVVAQNNTNYSTKQVRNIYISSDAPTNGTGGNGDIWLVYAP